MKSSENICLNCDYQLAEELYCPSCGQKTTAHNLSLKYLLSRFYIAFLDFDKKFFRSLRDIWVPNKISKDFLNGGRKTYTNHLRFFFISLVVMLSLTALHLKKKKIDLNQEERTAYVIDMLSNLDSLRSTSLHNCDTAFVLEFRSHLLKELKETEDTTRSFLNIDFNNFEEGLIEGTDDRRDIDAGIDKDDSHKPPFNFSDFFVLSTQDFIEKYKIEGPRKEFFISQLIKVIRNFNSAASYTIGNLLWGIILTTIIFAFVLGLYFWRSKAFYAEHLMQVINFHSMTAILFSLLLSLELAIDLSGAWYYLAFFAAFIHFLISLKRYHHQKWLKTAIKGLLLINTYFIVWSFVLILIVLVSVVLF